MKPYWVLNGLQIGLQKPQDCITYTSCGHNPLEPTWNCCSWSNIPISRNGIPDWNQTCIKLFCMCFSLVPRLSHSGMWTLKLYKHGQPGIFSHVNNIKGRERVERPNCAWAYLKIQNRKKSQSSRQLTTHLWLLGGKYHMQWVLKA